MDILKKIYVGLLGIVFSAMNQAMEVQSSKAPLSYGSRILKNIQAIPEEQISMIPLNIFSKLLKDSVGVCPFTVGQLKAIELQTDKRKILFENFVYFSDLQLNAFSADSAQYLLSLPLYNESLSACQKSLLRLRSQLVRVSVLAYPHQLNAANVQAWVNSQELAEFASLAEIIDKTARAIKSVDETVPQDKLDAFWASRQERLRAQYFILADTQERGSLVGKCQVVSKPGDFGTKSMHEELMATKKITTFTSATKQWLDQVLPILTRSGGGKPNASIVPSANENLERLLPKGLLDDKK